MFLSNLHTHSTYSDGRNTPLEIIEKAIELNFKSIGFSDHADCGHEIDCKELMKEDQVAYFELLDSYKKDFPQIQIFKGLELDSLDPTFEGNPDYTIGAIHFMKIDDKVYPIDHSFDNLKILVDLCGGVKAFVIKYYEQIVNFSTSFDFDIVAHLDLYTKYNEQTKLFDPHASWYVDIVKNVIEELTNLGKIIEINTGAIARGIRKTPYPDAHFFKFLKSFDSKVIVSSDAHYASKLNVGFDYAGKLLKENNINQVYNLTPLGFVPQNI